METSAAPHPEPTARRRGRPTLCTLENLQHLERLIRDLGCSDSQAASLLGLSPSTISRWKTARPELTQWFLGARIGWQHDRLKAIQEARGCDGQLHWRAQAWLLERQDPARFGPRRANQPCPDPTWLDSPDDQGEYEWDPDPAIAAAQFAEQIDRMENHSEPDFHNVNYSPLEAEPSPASINPHSEPAMQNVINSPLPVPPQPAPSATHSELPVHNVKYSSKVPVPGGIFPTLHRLSAQFARWVTPPKKV